MSKLNRVLVIVVLLLIVVLVGVVYWQKIGWESPYYAVYLNTGDIYFGKLNFFPKFSLSDVWFIQRNPTDQQSAEQSPLSLVKFNQAFWGPEDKMYLNKENVIWTVKLKKDSQVLSFIKNPPPPQTQPQSQQQTPPPQPSQ